MKENAAVRVIDIAGEWDWCERKVPKGAVICQNISYLYWWFPVVFKELKVFLPQTLKVALEQLDSSVSVEECYT